MPEKFGSDIIMSCCNLINNSSILRDFSLKFDMYDLNEWDQQKKVNSFDAVNQFLNLSHIKYRSPAKSLKT